MTKASCPQHCARCLKNFQLLILLLMLFAIAPIAKAVSIEVYDQNNQPLDDAVVSITAQSTKSNASRTPNTLVMDQKLKQFIPKVLIVQTGDSVRFPNSDEIRHHVYSFSKPKPFELPLYAGEPTQPIEFTNPGKVVVGCNIHDGMEGIIYVFDSDQYGLTKQGKISFANLAADDSYEIFIDHPDAELEIKEMIDDAKLASADTLKYTLTITNTTPQELSELEKKFMELRSDKN